MGKLFENFEPYDVQATRREARAEGKAEGILEGEAKGILKGEATAILMLLEEIGEVFDELQQVIMNENDMEVLNTWLKLAAKAETIEDFRMKAGI